MTLPYQLHRRQLRPSCLARETRKVHFMILDNYVEQVWATQLVVYT